MNEITNEAIEVENPVALMNAQAQAELDHQITTARAFPRSIKRFIEDVRNMATLDEATAEECIYALPRGGKTIEGPSVRMAELVLSAWGNCRAGARIVEEGAEFITAQGVFHDLQRNVQITMEVRRRIVDKHGRRYNSDMITTTGNAACSIAMRNAIFRGVPKALWAPLYEEARSVAVGNVETLANKRAKAMEYLQKLGVTPERVCAQLGVTGEEDIGLDELARLKGIANAIRQGEVTPEDAFPEPAEETKQIASSKGAAGLAERAKALKEATE